MKVPFIFILIAISFGHFAAKADGAKKQKAPKPGAYYYCDPNRRSIETLKVTAANVEDLDADEITLVCSANSASPSTCSLSSLVFSRSVQLKDDKKFIWNLVGDCGIGCNFQPILFSQNKSDITGCNK